MKTEVKICGLTRRCDVELAVRCGADYLGFVCYAGSWRYVDPARLPELTRGLPPHVRRVGVLVDASPAEVDAVIAGGVDIIQLHGDESPETARALAATVEVWRAVRLIPGADWRRLLDEPAARLVADGASGGGGVRCDWGAAAELACRRPLMLAGGIDAGNVAAAVAAVRPAGVDLAGGVEEAPGMKSEAKLKQFFQSMEREGLR